MRALRIALAVGLPLALLIPEDGAEARRRRFDKRAFKLEYRGALDRFARGQAEGALRRLVELESSVAAEAESDLDPLWKAKLSVIRDLLGSSPELLVPVSQLHEQAYLAYLERGAYLLAGHSRALTMELAELYSERVPGSRGDRVASEVMTSMAGHLHAAFVHSRAAALYRRAVELDPSNGAALLGLAAVLERQGEYERALPLLRNMVKIAPGDAEGRLRLAVQLIRVGDPEEAESVLSALIDEKIKEPRWVFSLAYQELARLLIDREEFDRAVELIDGATRALRGDPTLPILLTYLSDRARRPSGKAELTSALREAGRAEADSPRYRYSQMPRQALEQLRASLRGECDAQLPLLAEALSEEPALASAGGG